MSGLLKKDETTANKEAQSLAASLGLEGIEQSLQVLDEGRLGWWNAEHRHAGQPLDAIVMGMVWTSHLSCSCLELRMQLVWKADQAAVPSLHLAMAVRGP